MWVKCVALIEQKAFEINRKIFCCSRCLRNKNYSKRAKLVFILAESRCCCFEIDRLNTEQRLHAEAARRFASTETCMQTFYCPIKISALLSRKCRFFSWLILLEIKPFLCLSLALRIHFRLKSLTTARWKWQIIISLCKKRARTIISPRNTSREVLELWWLARSGEKINGVAEKKLIIAFER